jgi:hypothetical protein
MPKLNPQAITAELAAGLKRISPAAFSGDTAKAVILLVGVGFSTMVEQQAVAYDARRLADESCRTLIREYPQEFALLQQEYEGRTHEVLLRIFSGQISSADFEGAADCG